MVNFGPSYTYGYVHFFDSNTNKLVKTMRLERSDITMEIDGCVDGLPYTEEMFIKLLVEFIKKEKL